MRGEAPACSLPWSARAHADSAASLLQQGCRPVGTARRHAYCDEQLAYHYTKDPAVLARAVAALEEPEAAGEPHYSTRVTD